MDEQDLVAEIAKRFQIVVNFQHEGTAYWSSDHTLSVKLLFDDAVVSESETTIPNTERESF